MDRRIRRTRRTSQSEPRAERGRGTRRPGPPPARGWDHVANWYDRLVGDEGSDYHRNVIVPATLRMLDAQPGERLLDLCCGQGVLVRALMQSQPQAVMGVDASPKLIAAAKARGGDDARVRYVVRDARRLGDLADAQFDAAACVMAVHDLERVDELFAEISRALRPGGRAVVVLMHPCFRIPRQSEWGWDEAKKTRYRRIDRYASSLRVPIATHPGRDPQQHTVFYHRPLADYVNALGRAGLAITGCEELLTHRQSEPGSHSRGENRAAQEFPLFLALKAIRVAVSAEL
jgi:ubiquinone/menaquinone biosynthesis C-methylase UbiE